MASDLAKRANDAFVDDDYALAVELYSQAIELDPKNANLYADRAQANIKLENFTEAVADANKAIAFDPEMAKAYLRKGIACIKLEEYQTAKAALEKGAPLANGDTRFSKYIEDCDRHIEEETQELDVTNGSSSSISTAQAASESEKNVDYADDEACQAAVLPKPKFRHDFYNSPNEVVVTIFAKGIPANSVLVDFGEQTLSVTIEIPGEEAYILQPRLFAKIVPDKCKYVVLGTKIEIRLAKAEPITWASLEYSKTKSVPQKASTPAASSAPRPAYPYSKTKVDWDKLEFQVKKEEKEEKLDGDAALNKFFRDIYQDADEDMRRAMSKSFVESNGTVLSTNWKEVGTKKVEGSPPDGMELKKWEY